MSASSNPSAGLRSFAAVERFLSEAASDARRPGYVLLGDDAFLLQRARRGVLDALVPADLRDFCLHDLDLVETSIFEALDLAQTPSLMAPFQVIFIRNVKTLYGRGQKKDEFAAIDDYFRRPNPQALIIFIADHVRLPQDLRTMDMQDKERAEKIRETLGDACGIIELQRVSDDDAVQWAIREAASQKIRLAEDAARELVDALGAEMLTLQSELSKLILYAESQNSSSIELADVETMVSAAKQRSLYELTDAISAKDAPRAVALLHGLLNASEAGEDASIGHVFSLAKTFRQMLVLNEKQVRDQRAIWQVLWPGFRVAPFAADALIAQARRYRDRSELTRGIELIARADAELRSNPADKRLVLERLVLRLATVQQPGTDRLMDA
ncbi:MAG TPA: DNA polymerase III subunit delta [Acidobacteriaceae bacterium]|nr:DNA polymerase III subunit delta [Acidobacteriaceae bacterium]